MAWALNFWFWYLCKVALGRNISRSQAAGCVLIVASIPLAKMYDLWSLSSSVLTPSILLMSQFCAVLSTAAAVSVEVCARRIWLIYYEKVHIFHTANIYVFSICQNNYCGRHPDCNTFLCDFKSKDSGAGFAKSRKVQGENEALLTKQTLRNQQRIVRISSAFRSGFSWNFGTAVSHLQLRSRALLLMRITNLRTR